MSLLEETTPSQTTSELSLRDYMDLLRRRKAIVIQTFMVVFVLGVAVTFMAKPVYRTSARILVEGRSYNVASYTSDNPLVGLFTPDSGHDILTQLEVLQGDRVLADAYKDGDVPPGSAHLDVRQVNGTDVIELLVESNTPTYAERLAKALPNTYLNYVTGNRKKEVNDAYNFASNRLKEENEKLTQAELSYERFKKNAGITSLETERDARIGEAGEAQANVRTLEGQYASAEALTRKLEETQKGLKPISETSLEQSNDTQLHNLQASIDSREVSRQSLLLLFKPEHPKVQAVDLEIAELKRQLAHTPLTIKSTTRTPNLAVETYAARVADSQAQALSLAAQLKQARDRSDKAQAGLGNYSALERQQSQLVRDMEIHRGTVTLLLKSVEDLGLRQKATHDPVLVIAPAAPAVQVAPKKLNNLVYASLVGLMLGLCFALLQEFLDDRINSPEDARRIVGTPALGYVPMIENEEARLLSGSRSGGSVLESYRVLRSNVRFAAVDTPIHSLLVTSTVPGEGKSVTAYNLAVAMALDGRNVILVDTDLRRPTMHEKAKVSQQPGLTNVLVGHTTLEDAIKETTIPGLRVLPAGPLPPNPAELLNSQAMKQLHKALKDQADIVIFDSPPCLATADAQVMAAETDGVLYVVQFGEAKKSAVRHAVEMLRQARTRILGVVFNKIDLTAKRDAYYYGYYGYYGYYQTTQLEDGRPRRRRSTAEFEALLPRNSATAREQSATNRAAQDAEGPRSPIGPAPSHDADDDDMDEEA
jgi:succinoglycan biosynthesis transport protein ExoP